MTQFVITVAGNAAVSAASPTGPFVNIVAFKIGSDFAAVPSDLDTDVVGTVLYSSTPSSYASLDAQTVGVRCEIPASVGPFTFGNIGLFLPGNVLFARASFGSPQQKQVGSISGVPNAWRITAALKFSQAPALFSILTSSMNQVLEVADFSLLSSPSTMLGSPNQVVVHETTPYGEDPLLWKKDGLTWSVDKYTLLSTGTVTASTASSTSFTALNGASTRQYLLQFPNGDIRAVANFVGTVGNLTQNRAAALVGSSFRILKADAPSFTAPVLTATEYNALAATFNSVWSTPSGVTPSTAKGFNQTAVATVAPGVTPTSGNWASLVTPVQTLASLLDVPASIPLASIQSDWSVGMASQVLQYTALAQLVQTVSSVKSGEIDPAYMTVSPSVTRTRTSVYTQVHHDISVTFVSATSAQAFFNSGGYIAYTLALTADNMVQTIQKYALASLGPIRFCAGKTSSTNSVSVVTREGDGVIADLGNCGYYGLSGSRKRVWSYVVPTATQPGTGTNTGYINFEVYSTRISATVFNLEFWITDTSGAVYSNASNSPPPSITSAIQIGTAPSAYFSSPPMVAPTVATLPSTVW
jgi:hypothetical protein